MVVVVVVVVMVVAVCVCVCVDAVTSSPPCGQYNILSTY